MHCISLKLLPAPPLDLTPYSAPLTAAYFAVSLPENVYAPDNFHQFPISNSALHAVTFHLNGFGHLCSLPIAKKKKRKSHY